MTDFLDDTHYHYEEPVGRALYELLVSTYFYVDQIQKKVRPAGIPPAEVDWSGSAADVWISVLDTAAIKGKLRGLLTEVKTTDATVGTRIDELLADTPVLPPSPASDAPALDGADWQGEPEKQTGAEPTLLDITFLERGLELARSVVRLLVTMNSGKRFNGTGWLITPNLLLTNHHVLFDDEEGGDGLPATAVEVWFGFDRDFGGANRTPVKVPGDVATIQGEKDDDWAVIEFDTTNAPAGLVPIDLTETAVTALDERVYIIQHPGGGPKKIGMIHNVVRHADPEIVQYLTDTLGGSSGAPVFNEEWLVVALHHWGKTVDVNGTREIRNQGRTIGRVLEGLHAHGVL